MIVADQLKIISKFQCYSLIYYYFPNSFKPKGELASCFLNEYLFHISDSHILHHRNPRERLFWLQLLPGIHYPSLFFFFTDLLHSFYICTDRSSSHLLKYAGIAKIGQVLQKTSQVLVFSIFLRIVHRGLDYYMNKTEVNSLHLMGVIGH